MYNMGTIFTSFLASDDTEGSIVNKITNLEQYDRDTYLKSRQLKQKLLYDKTLAESDTDADDLLIVSIKSN